MSRNLARTDCDACPGLEEHIVLEESPRPVTADDVGNHWLGEYVGLVVANARCVLCHALYLAWVDWPNSRSFGHWSLARRQEHDKGARFCDLSYRYAFNDEPYVLDLPIYEVTQITSYKRVPILPNPDGTCVAYARPEDKQAYQERWERTVRAGRTIADELKSAPKCAQKEDGA